MSAFAYRYPVDKLLTGASFGNLEAFLKLTPQSDVAGLWSARDNQFYCGRWVTQIFVNGERATPLETTHAQAYQATSYGCGALQIRKLVFVPMCDPLGVLRVVVEFRNAGDDVAEAAVMCDVHYPAFVWAGTYKVPDHAQRNKRVRNREQDGLIISATIDRPQEVRVFGGDADVVSTYVSDRGFSRTHATRVPAHGTASVSFTMAISDRGEAAAIRTFEEAPRADAALAETDDFYERLLRTGYLRTPDPLVNRAIDWAKVNTVRVQHRYPAGHGFTNDPSQDIVVVRDAAWYALGSDYITPEFSRRLFELIAQHGIEEGGKVTEYIVACADPPFKSDYDLNINDDTPLIVCAAFHHYSVTHDRAALERIWPMVRGACDWIISQSKDGLVVAHSQEANVWGISGWRNIIPQSQISGAVTEINAECARALLLAATLARILGDAQTADRYRAAADRLKDAINRRLISADTGLYLLNIDPEGEPHHDITGDQIFPVLFAIASEERKRAILELLYTAEFWTPFGVRTVGRNQQEYDPDHGVQLLGGIWPNLTAWVAYCSKSYSPRRMVSAMRNIWKISEVENPKAYHNVMPGMFPERLSGETFKSRGMAMSPWMPPTYLWLAYEGPMGLEPSPDGLRVNPHLPSDWKWIGVRELPTMGTTLTCFYYRRTLYSSIPVASRGHCVVLNEDVSRSITSNITFAVALADERETLVFLATDREGTFEYTLHPPIVPATETNTVTLAAGEARLLRLRKRRTT
ncbi:MAG TPA: amylo-alpha-1,6-glucosidase [Candidatus Acidoferrales bacterium]|nr:amylo-alpha-1,6-glucosidase [Candidatus Acidoferrales bacterium]